MKINLKLMVLALVCAAFGLTATAQKLSYLKISTQGDDPAVYVPLSQHPEVSVIDNGVEVTAGDDKMTFVFASQPHFEFSAESSVESIEAAKAVIFSYTGGVVTIKGLVAGSPVAIYGIDGRCAVAGNADVDGAWSHTVAGTLTAGVYIVKTEKTTTKIIVK